jgi:autotransporter-associated beta strand protein
MLFSRTRPTAALVRPRAWRRRLMAASLSSATLAPFAAHGQNATWLAAPPDSSFNNAANWSPAVLPTGTAIFDASATTTIQVTNFLPAALQFQAGAPAYTFNFGSGATTLFAGAGIINNSANAPTINISSSSTLQLGGGATLANAIVNSSNGSLRFTGGTTTAGDANITVGAGGSVQFLAGTAGNATFSVTGNLSSVRFDNSSSAGNATFTVANGGTLNFFNAASGGNAVITLGTGGLLRISQLNLVSGMTLVSLAGTGGNVELGDKQLTIGSNGLSTSLDAVVFGTGGSLVKVGAGTLTLSGANTYTGGTTVDAGTLRQGALGGFVASTPYTVNAGTLDLNSFNLTASSLSGTGGTIALGTANLTVNQAGSTSYDGVVTGGAGSLTLAGGTLTLTGANSYGGGTTVTGGTLVGTSTSLQGAIVNNAAVTFDQATAGTYAGAMSGTGTLTKAGAGTLDLTGTNTYGGATTVSGGTLAVNGSITSAVTVNSGGTLGGGGTVGSTTIANGGRFAPGNSIGTTTVAGNVSFAPGSVYEVEANAVGAADRIDAGTATLTGGTVQVLAEAGTYQSSTQYTILSTTGGVTGTFAGVTSNLAFLTPSLSYVGNNVLLTLTSNGTSFSAVAQTPNQRAVSNYLDAVEGDPGVQALMTSLSGLSVEQAQTAFRSLSGESLTAGRRVAMAAGAHFADTLTSRLGLGGEGTGLAFSGIQVASLDLAQSGISTTGIGEAGSAQGKGFWLRASGLGGDVDGTDDASGYDYRGGGLAMGFDAEVADAMRAGVALSYTTSKATLDQGAGTSKVRSPQLAVYGSHAAGPLLFKGVFGLAQHDIEDRRNVVVGASVSTAQSQHDAFEWLAYGEASYAFKLAGYELQPLVGLRYVNLDEKGYTETGSAANLAVSPQKTESILPMIGVRYVQPFSMKRGVFEARAIYSHESGDVDPALTGRLAGATSGATFTATGVPVGRDALTLGAGVSHQMQRNLSLYVDGSVELRERQNAYALLGGLRYGF